VKITNSNDINLLIIRVVFDITGTTPTILLENESLGDDLASCTFWFVVTSPTGTTIHEGSASVPDETGVWTNATIADAWPRPFNQIEWSGPPYVFQAFVKDGAGNVYAGDVQNAAICRPNGNLPTSKNTYGVASVLVQVKCEQGRIYFQDITNTSYKGLEGVIGSSLLRVNFPMDETGNVPDPFVGSNFSTALVPVTYSGKGYQFLVTSLYEYELSEHTFVRIKYLKSDTFGVWCNIDLMPLLCEYQKMIDSIENGSCSNAEAANQKLMLINPKFSMVVMGMFQPLLGIDVPALIEEIKLIGGFDCDCCNAATGIIPVNSSVIDGYNFSVVTTCGDVGGSFVPNGNNIQLLLNDKAYVFKMCDGSPSETSAFSINNSIAGCVKTYCLNVDVAQFAEDMLTVISTDAALVNLFNSIVLSAGEGNFQLIVDGGCIFSSSQSCDYTFSMNPIPASTTFAILAYIQTSDQLYNLNYAFNLSSLPALQTALNALGIGTFIVTDAGGQTVLITSTGNTNNILALAYKNPLLSIATMTKDCVGYTPLSANEVVQNIINYICDLDDTQVDTSQDYEICYIDPADSTQKTATVSSGVPLNTFITELLARGCDTINYIVSLGAVNCNAIKAAFPLSSNAMQANDVFLNTRAGACSQINPIEALYTMLTYGINNTDVMTAFCAMVAACSGGLPCSPYDYFYATIDAGSPAGSEIDLIVTFSHPDAVSNTIRYGRIDNTTTPTYITIPGILPGQSPYTISESPALENGQWRVYIKPVYADGRLCSESFFDTPACTGVNSFSASYNGTTIDITYNVQGSVPNVRVNISYPNGGSSSTIYTNGDVISITPPPNVYGTFFATMQPVCDEDTGFFGAATAQSAFVINPPNNSSITNNASFFQSAFQIFTISPNITQAGTQVLDIGDSVAFYLADGTYGSLYVQVDAAERDDMALSLVTGTGTYYGTPNGTNYFLFTGIPILNGATLVLTDDSSPSGDNYVLSASYNLSIDAVSGSGIPVLPPTGVNGTQSGVQTGMSGSYNVTLSGTVVVTTKLTASVNSVEVDCIAVPTAGVYALSITAAGGDDVRISVNSGAC
jgi:hypothetical protein